MKKIVPFLIAASMVLFFNRNTQAQFALFVNDNGVYSYNTDTVLSSLAGAGIDCDIFSTRDSLRAPTAAEMQPYTVVIWYCSTDGVGNYLWNGNDSENTELMVYLDNGGSLWLMGTDFMYDRYGGAPDLFQPGDFCYDYLGISEYVAQTYGDDGGLGVPQLDLSIWWSGTLPQTINWTFPTAWWVDGCTPVGNAVPLYEMGPESYPLHGLSAAVYNHENFVAREKEITFFFDPAIIDTYENRVELFLGIFNSIFIPPPGFDELPKATVPLIRGQNPVADKLQCKAPESIAGSTFQVSISDFTGKQVVSLPDVKSDVFDVDVSSLKPGMYVLTISDTKRLYSQKFVVSR